MKNKLQRQVHLDFHTPGYVTGVAEQFNPDEFAQTLLEAHVQSVTVFAKCQFGYCYYPTKVGVVHPGLPKGVDWLGETLEACHKRDIACPIYICVRYEEVAGILHPEWAAVDEFGKPHDSGPLGTGTIIMDMASPYTDYLEEISREVVKNYDVDGIFFDICHEQPSVGVWSIRNMRRLNLDPNNPLDRRKHEHIVAHDYMKRFYALVKSHHKNAGVWFNSRPILKFDEDASFDTHIEIEGEHYGRQRLLRYMKFIARYARTRERYFVCMTVRFHHSWKDFGTVKPKEMMEYETMRALAMGGGVSIGDHLPADGKLIKDVYQSIGYAFAQAKSVEPWWKNATAVSEIALMAATPDIYAESIPWELGAVDMLDQLHLQFDVLRQQDTLRQLKKYKLIILPDQIRVEDQFKSKLQAYLRAGGKVLMSHASGMGIGGDAFTLFSDALQHCGFSEAQTQHSSIYCKSAYYKVGKAISAGIPDMPHAIYDQYSLIRPKKHVTKLADLMGLYPYNPDRCFKPTNINPPNVKTMAGGIWQIGDHGIYVAWPIFTGYFNHGYPIWRQTVANCIRRLLPSSIVEADIPTTAELHLTRQDNPKRYMVHILSYFAPQRTIDNEVIENIVPLYDVPVTLRIKEKPRRVYVAPDGTDLPFIIEKGQIRFTVPKVNGWSISVVEM